MDLESAKKEILKRSKTGNVTIVVGETGSGKSTEVPQLFLRSSATEKVVVTEPRRVAAISLYERVKYLAGDLGGQVGYKVRFQDVTNRKTRLTYVTDGMLLKWIENEAVSGTVIVDEVHERSVRTDVIMGVLKKSIKKIRLVLMSATVDLNLLVKYFEKDGIEVSVIRIEGKAHPVQIKYLPKRTSDYIDTAYNTIKKIIKETRDARRAGSGSFGRGDDGRGGGKGSDGSNSGISSDTKYNSNNTTRHNTHHHNTTSKPKKAKNEIDDEIDRIFKKEESEEVRGADRSSFFLSGSILVFLSGIEDIEDLCRMIEGFPDVEILKMHSSISDSEQKQIFSRRAANIRVILSTNIAETSLTIPDVKWVVDSGVQKITMSKNGIEHLGVVKISKSSAKQRAGRAGRVGPGVCYRLYTESTFKQLEENNVPEILRTNVASVCLSLVAKGEHPLEFDFLEPPSRDSLMASLRELFVLGLIDKSGNITELGKLVSKLPLSPSLGKFLVSGKSLQIPCTAAAICAMLSSESPFIFSDIRDRSRRTPERFSDASWAVPRESDDEMRPPAAKEETASRMKSVHNNAAKESDLTICAAVLFRFVNLPRALQKDFCHSAGVSLKEMATAAKVYQQLLSLIGAVPSDCASEIHSELLEPPESEKICEKPLEKEKNTQTDEKRPAASLARVRGGAEKEALSSPSSISLTCATADRVHAAGSSSFLTRVAQILKNGGYLHLYSNTTVFVHPSSSLFHKREERISFILAAQTSKPYVLYVFPYVPPHVLA